MSVKVKDILSVMQEIAPSEFAYDWDNVGLLVGDAQDAVQAIGIALDITPQVIRQAQAMGVTLLISHHPLFMEATKRMTASSADGALALFMARSGMSMIAAHTNLDVAPGGVNDVLAHRLGLSRCAPLQAQPGQPYYKLVVFVPAAQAQAVADALGDAGAGSLGDYSHCSFRVKGIGQFLPEEGASPAIGNVGNLESVEEARLEAIVPVHRLCAALQAMRAAHPYETVAYDLFPIQIEEPAYGIGRIARLDTTLSLEEFARWAAKQLDCEDVRVVGSRERSGQRVALCGGAGGSVMQDALRMGADVLLTGEVKHHELLWAQQMGLGLVLAGHDCTERVIVPALCACLQSKLDALQYNLRVYALEQNRPTWLLK